MSSASSLSGADGGTGVNGHPLSAPLTLVLADHHPLTLRGLCQLFEKEVGCAVLAACSDAATALDAVRKHSPSVLIIDVELPADGAFSTAEVRPERLPTHVVLLATTLDDDRVLDAVRLGARGVILKEMSPELLVRCVRESRWRKLAGEGSGRRGAEQDGEAEIATRQLARGLTPRETEIVRHAIRGMPGKEIATRLAVRHGTVKVHLHNIYAKLQVNGRLGLILFARRQGLV